MTAFWTWAAVLLMGALAVLSPLLLRRRGGGASDSGAANLLVLRDQLAEMQAELAAGTLSHDQYGAARNELERRVLEETAANDALRGDARSPLLALVLAVGVPLFAGGLYLQLGNRDGIAWQEFVAAEAAGAAPADPRQMEEVVERLAQGLAKNPGNADGWLMLARSYGAMGRFAEASGAYARASALLPRDAQLLADYADTLAMAQGRNAEGEPWRLIEQALQLDPDNLKALALAGSAAFARRDFGGAAQYWQKAVRLAPPQSEFARSMQEALVDARRLALGAVPAPSGAAPVAIAQASGAAAPGVVAGRVTLSAALAAGVAPTDTVFIFARASQGPRMPLAILRRTAAELPLKFVLDDSLAMAPEMKLSKFQSVVVEARISKSGNAMPQPGDLQGQSPPVAVGSREMEIVIDRRVP